MIIQQSKLLLALGSWLLALSCLLVGCMTYQAEMEEGVGATEQAIPTSSSAVPSVEGVEEEATPAELSKPKTLETRAAGQSSRMHAVIPGDTLWDLSARYLNDPFRWEEIYAVNKGAIQNPHWIYPDQRFSIPGPVSSQAPKEETPPASEDNRREMQVSPQFNFDGYITGVRDEKLMISVDDIVYLDIGQNKRLRAGMRVIAYRKAHEIRHVETNEPLGFVIRKIAVLKVSKEVEEKTSAAKVIVSYEPLEIGDLVKIVKN